MKRSLCGSVALLMLCSLASAADPIPTDQDLQQMFASGDYRACLQQTVRALALNGGLAKAYDPFVLQMRRGDCLLNLGDQYTAAIAFAAALAAADTPTKGEEARAVVALLKACKGVNYIPPGGTAINIAPVDGRKRAMAALCTDRLAALGQEYRTALNAPTLTPIIDFFPKIQELHALEMVGTGADPQTQPILLALGDHARELIGQELRSVAGHVDTIQQRANQMVASGNTTVTINGSPWWMADTRVGLSPDDRDSLRATADYLVQIINVCQEGKQAALSFGRDGKIWDPLISDGQDVLNRAKIVLDAE